MCVCLFYHDKKRKLANSLLMKSFLSSALSPYLSMDDSVTGSLEKYSEQGSWLWVMCGLRKRY